MTTEVPTTQQVSSAAFKRHQALHANVIRACTKCNAPGIYTDRADVEQNWPGCYVATTSPHCGKPVGDFCPNCGGLRKKDEPHGVVSEKWEYKLSLAGAGLRVKHEVVKLIRRIFR